MQHVHDDVTVVCIAVVGYVTTMVQREKELNSDQKKCSKDGSHTFK